MFVVRPGATSSVLAPSSDGLQPTCDGLHPVAPLLLVAEFLWQVICDSGLELDYDHLVVAAGPFDVERQATHFERQEYMS